MTAADRRRLGIMPGFGGGTNTKHENYCLQGDTADFFIEIISQYPFWAAEI
jgi:hypothetical protein